MFSGYVSLPRPLCADSVLSSRGRCWVGAIILPYGSGWAPYGAPNITHIGPELGLSA